MSEGESHAAEVAAALARVRDALAVGDVLSATAILEPLLAPLNRWIHRQAVWHATQLGLPISEADEVMQRALEALWRLLCKGGTVTDLTGFLVRSLSFNSLDLRRQVRRLVSLEGLLDDEEEHNFARLGAATCEDDDPAARALRQASDSHAQQLIGILRKPLWRAVMTLWLAHTPYQVIGETLGITPARVDSCIRSSLRFLRRKHERGEVDLS